MKRRDVEIEAGKVRRKQDAAFPLTLEEFRSRSRSIQVRVASYLSSGAAKRERVMTEFGWTYGEVTLLTREFEMNVSSFILWIQSTKDSWPILMEERVPGWDNKTSWNSRVKRSQAKVEIEGPMLTVLLLESTNLTCLYCFKLWLFIDTVM